MLAYRARWGLLSFLLCSLHAQDQRQSTDRPAQGRITGHVLCNDTRRPARGATVMVAPVALDGQDLHPGQGMASAHVAADGTYLVEHLRPGRYTLFVFQPGYLNRFDQIVAANKDPKKQAVLLEANGTVSLRGAETLTLDATLERGATLSGRVLFADGAPAIAANMQVEAVDRREPSTKTSEGIAATVLHNLLTKESFTTDDRGRFRLAGLRPGRYRLAAVEPIAASSYGTFDPDEQTGNFFFGNSADPRATRVYSGNTVHRKAAAIYELHGADEVTDIEITLPADGLHRVHGMVMAQGGQQANIGHVLLSDNADPELTFRATVRSDGSFTLHQVPPGTYTLSITGAAWTPPTDGVPGVPSTGTGQGLSFKDSDQALLVQDRDVDDVQVVLSSMSNPVPRSTGAPVP